MAGWAAADARIHALLVDRDADTRQMYAELAAAIEAAAATREIVSATRERIERTIAEARRLRYLSQINRRYARSLRAVQ